MISAAIFYIRIGRGQIDRGFDVMPFIFLELALYGLCAFLFGLG